MRRQYEAWLTEFDPDLFMTLGANRPVSIEMMDRTAREFFNHVHRKGLGPRWSKKPDCDRGHAIGFLEHPLTNTHLHLAVKAPDPIQDIIVNGGEIWKGILSGGHFYAGRAENPEAIARYVTKDFWKLGPDAAVFLYA